MRDVGVGDARKWDTSTSDSSKGNMCAILVEPSGHRRKQARLLDGRVTQAVVPNSSRYEQFL